MIVLEVLIIIDLIIALMVLIHFYMWFSNAKKACKEKYGDKIDLLPHDYFYGMKGLPRLVLYSLVPIFNILFFIAEVSVYEDGINDIVENCGKQIEATENIINNNILN